MAEFDPFYPGHMAEWPEDLGAHLDAAYDLTNLANTLSTSQHRPSAIHDNVSAVMDSPSSHLLVTHSPDGEIITTLTLNQNRVLTGNGSEFWIDDVATTEAWQRQGHNKRMMDAGETLAAQLGGNAVYLSSSVDRGPARHGYESRGYVLLNEAEDPAARRVIYRSTKIGKPAVAPTDDIDVLDANFTAKDVDELAALLGTSPRQVEQNLEAAVNSPTTRVYVARPIGRTITGVAVGNKTPIPVGQKPWISDVAGRVPEDCNAVIAATGNWLGSGYKHVNMIAPPDQEFGHGFELRTSGLYVKALGAEMLRGGNYGN